MVRRFLLSGAILLFILLFVPACNSNRNTGKGGTPPTNMPPDKPPPEPKPAGKAG